MFLLVILFTLLFTHLFECIEIDCTMALKLIISLETHKLRNYILIYSFKHLVHVYVYASKKKECKIE